jgi:DUF4097 and DUF4098 domain-containing protein YvlB
VQRFETPGEVALRIAIGSGKVEVSAGSPGLTEVEVVPLRDDEGTRRAAAETRVELVDRGDRQEILVETPERHELGFIGVRRGPKLGVVVRCPSGADLSLKTASASLRATGALGEVQAKTASGDVLLENVRALDVATASGDLTAHSVADACSVKTASGDARLRTVGGPLTVSLVSGDLQLEEALGSVAVSTVSGDQRIGAVSAGPVKLSSVSGDVRVGVRPGLRLYLDVGTVGGTARSDLDSDEPSGEPEGEVLELRVRTVSGDARIERAAGASVGA